MTTARLAIEGEFNIFAAGELHARLLDALSGDATELEVDLSGVTEIDTTGDAPDDPGKTTRIRREETAAAFA